MTYKMTMNPESPAATELIAREANCILQTYKRKPVVFARGDGNRLFDQEGRSYLDFGSGIAVNALGYNHPAITSAIIAQSSELIHCSNLYHSLPMIRLAETLVEHSFGSKIFFCNSGTEANEAALKFARRHALTVQPDGTKTNFVAFNQGFHGRTMGSLSVTPKAAIQDPFRPLIPGVKFGVFNQTQDLHSLIDASTAGVIVEPIQGEGGMHVATAEFLTALRAACDAANAVLIFDEVQCGIGRTGDLWAHQSAGIKPDIMTLAKPLGGGLPIGAVVLNERTASAVKYGDHGSTFGGNPLAAAVANAVLSIVLEPSFMQHVKEASRTLESTLIRLKSRYPEKIMAIRGRGLMWGIDTAACADSLIDAGLANGLVFLSAGPQTIRLLPPLTISEGDVAEFAEVMEELLHD